jgi:hypothetical protein
MPQYTYLINSIVPLVLKKFLLAFEPEGSSPTLQELAEANDAEPYESSPVSLL